MADRIVLALLVCLPRRLARHAMFLLTQQRRIADGWGYHIRAIHYYDPLPDFREITPESTLRRRTPVAIDFHLSEQIALAQRLGASYGRELEKLARAPESEGFDFDNDYFPGMDAAVYYALIRELRPRRIIEIGSGYSTRIADKALRRNRAAGYEGQLTCVEPYPEPRLTDAQLEIQLIQQRVEQVDLAIFQQLQANDILFIDSSHAVKFGSDVCHEFLEILPRLQTGVWIHVHDVFFPHDYPAEWLIDKRVAFNEQYLLEAFLCFNDAFSVQIANYWLTLDHADAVQPLWPGQRVQPRAGSRGAASFWMKKTR